MKKLTFVVFNTKDGATYVQEQTNDHGIPVEDVYRKTKIIIYIIN